MSTSHRNPRTTNHRPDFIEEHMDDETDEPEETTPRERRRQWVARITPRNVPTRPWLIHFCLSVAAILIICFGLMLAGTGAKTVDLKYGVFLDRMGVIVMIGTLLMALVPGYLAVKEKNWLRLGLLVIILVATSPALISFFMGMFAGIGKPLGMMGLPVVLAPVLHAILMYWVGFQGLASRKVAGLERQLRARQAEADRHRPQAETDQQLLDQYNANLTTANNAAEETHDRLVEAQESSKEAREAHDAFVKSDQTVSDAELKLELAKRQTELSKNRMERDYEAAQPKRGRTPEVQADLEADYNASIQAYRQDRQAEIEADRELTSVKQAIEASPTGQRLADCLQAEKDAGTEDAAARKAAADAKQRHADQQVRTNTSRATVTKADAEVTKLNDKLTNARQRMAAQRTTWLVVVVLLLLGTLVLYSSWYGAILLRPNVDRASALGALTAFLA